MIKVESGKALAVALSNTLNADEALVALYDGSVGVATMNEPGYRRARVYTGTKDYNVTSEMTREANTILFPDRDPRETEKIILSSMRKSGESAVVICRPAGETTLNGMEYLKESPKDGEDPEECPIKKFDNIDAAKQFLRDNGCDEMSEEEIDDEFTFEIYDKRIHG